jgi:hypothetical protein
MTCEWRCLIVNSISCIASLLTGLAVLSGCDPIWQMDLTRSLAISGEPARVKMAILNTAGILSAKEVEGQDGVFEFMSQYGRGIAQIRPDADTVNVTLHSMGLGSKPLGHERNETDEFLDRLSDNIRAACDP